MKVFISHSSTDKKFVEEMIKFIGGDITYFDKYSFEPTESLTESIKKSIDDCDIFVLLISQDCLNSSWCQEEILYVTPLIIRKGIKFLPFSIDSSIKPKDKRLDDWVWNLLVKNYDYPKLLARVIQRRVYESLASKNSKWGHTSVPLIGRNKDMERLENIYHQSEFERLRTIFVSGFPLVGRKSLLRKFLYDYIRPTDKYYQPLGIRLVSTDSIVQFVLQLNDKIGITTNDEILLSISEREKSAICWAISIISCLFDYQERIIIEDDACIVNSGGRIADWFLEIIKSADYPSVVMLFVASRYRPNPSFVNENVAIIEIPISTIDKKSMGNLLANRLDANDLKMDVAYRNEIVDTLTGYPKQIIDVCEYYKNHSIAQTKEYANTLKESYYKNYSVIIEQLSEDAKNLLILLAKFDFASEYLLAEIYQGADYINPLNELDKYSLYEVFGESHNLISLNSAVADYVTRVKLRLNPVITSKLKSVTNKLLNDIDGAIIDLSSHLYAIKEYIRSTPKEIKVQYLIPSFTLKVIVEEYHNEKYIQVINIAKRLINDYKPINKENSINAVHFWYICALCREQQRDEFEYEISYFSNNPFDYNFLRGFYYRLSDKKAHKKKSLEYYTEAMRNKEFASVSCTSVSKILHEQVVVMMQLLQYADALDLAKQNYENNSHNPYHIHAYFDCLIKSHKVTTPNVPKELIEAMQKTMENTTQVYVQTMQAQYKFYIENDLSASIVIFRRIFRNPNNVKGMNYARESLYEICNVRCCLDIYDDIIKNSVVKV